MINVKKITLIICSLILPAYCLATDNSDEESRSLEEAVGVTVYNDTVVNLSLADKTLTWGRWGSLPAKEIVSGKSAYYHSKGKSFSGPEATVVYSLLNHDKETVYLNIYTNMDHFHPQDATFRACLGIDKWNSGKMCVGPGETASFKGITIKGHYEGQNNYNWEQYFSVGVKDTALCNSASTTLLEKKYIQSITALSHIHNNTKYLHKFTLQDGTVFDVHKDAEGVLDIVKSAYHSLMSVDICNYTKDVSIKNDAHAVYIHE